MFKYIAIKNELKKIIDTSEAHTMLPSRNEIIKEYGVSDITVRKALDELLREGLIYSHHGKGSFVAPKRKEYPEVYNVMQGTEIRHFKDKSGWYFPLVEELETQLEKNEMEMTISFHKRNADMERQILERLQNKSPYGVVFYYSGHRSNIPYYQKVYDAVPNCVFVDRYIEEIKSNYVGTDNVSSAKLLGEKVSLETPEKIYIIDLDWWNRTNVSDERQEGFVLGAKNSDYTILTSNKSYYDDLKIIGDYIKKDIQNKQKIGFLCMNSYMTADIFEECEEVLKDKEIIVGTFEKPDIKEELKANLYWARQNLSRIAEETVRLIKNNLKEKEHILVPAEIISEKK
ncbi:MAG: GntR family transcriptional regulator [Armatimonadetes bacterium]|nr:GntR family transcriptional regulator [Candidatus Hippobium faecium]